MSQLKNSKFKLRLFLDGRIPPLPHKSKTLQGNVDVFIIGQSVSNNLSTNSCTGSNRIQLARTSLAETCATGPKETRLLHVYINVLYSDNYCLNLHRARQKCLHASLIILRHVSAIGHKIGALQNHTGV